MAVERADDRDPAWIPLRIGAVAVLVFLVFGVVVGIRAYESGGPRIGDTTTLACSTFLTGGYRSYAREGWILSSDADIATCEQCPFECDSFANRWSVDETVYPVTLTYCPRGSHLIGRHTDNLGDTVVNGCR